MRVTLPITDWFGLLLGAIGEFSMSLFSQVMDRNRWKTW